MDRTEGKHIKDWSPLVGKRCLVVDDFPLSEGIEVKVIEISPSGRFVKLEYGGGMKFWKYGAKYLLIECLD